MYDFKIQNHLTLLNPLLALLFLINNLFNAK